MFKGVATIYGAESAQIPEDWLRAIAENYLAPEEMAAIKSLGSWDEIMETLRQRLAEQQERHQGGSKWIGTGGTSPYGNSGYNPEGVRIGGESRHKRAIKVWDKRAFRNLDNTRELGTRNIKIALKRLRRWVREGAAEEFDLPGTIHATAEHGYLDVRVRPERRNAVKLLMFFDVGGSMDDHIRVVEELFSAASAEFRQLEFFYFHNCLYEGVWKDNRRRHSEVMATWDVLNKYGHDYKVVFVGDAAMSPYEIAHPGGSVEHWNEEAGAVWLKRALDQWPNAIWINPIKEKHWSYTHSIGMIRDIFSERMYPLTLSGLETATRELSRRH
jgi:uncharacterized protein with von Willebrand factor type A (vWA) domain